MGDTRWLPAHGLGAPRFAHNVVDGRRDGEHRNDDGEWVEPEIHRAPNPPHHPDYRASMGKPTVSLLGCHTVLLKDYCATF